MSGCSRFAFALLMVALTGLFIGLGVWQMQRLGEKEALIARVADRIDAPPVALPPSSEWETVDPATLDYAPVTVTGHYVPNHTIMVFTSLTSPKGEASGPGYWVMTAFALDAGGAILVNRGFIPQDDRLAFVNGQGVDEGPQTLTGIARQPEAVGSFTPEDNLEDRIGYVRDPKRLWLLVGPSLGSFAPWTLDVPAGPPGALPQGGETVAEFPNNHLGYAFTWFGFAIITPILLFFWLRRQRRPKAP